MELVAPLAVDLSDTPGHRALGAYLMKFLTCPFCGEPETVCVEDDTIEELVIGETEISHNQGHLQARVTSAGAFTNGTSAWCAGDPCVVYLRGLIDEQAEAIALLLREKQVS